MLSDLVNLNALIHDFNEPTTQQQATQLNSATITTNLQASPTLVSQSVSQLVTSNQPTTKQQLLQYVQD